MPFADLEDARKHHAALLEIMIHRPGGWADRQSLRTVVELCGAARNAIEDTECSEHIGIVAAYAAALFSEESHRRWDRGNTRGADFLRLEIVRALHRINLRLSEIETMRRGISAGFDKIRQGPLD
jgi:hypothetical protein